MTDRDWLRTDEAEGAIGFASEWLELDSSDDWVRNDSETVSPLTHLGSLSRGVITILLGTEHRLCYWEGTPPGIVLRVVSWSSDHNPSRPTKACLHRLVRPSCQRVSESKPIYLFICSHTHLRP